MSRKASIEAAACDLAYVILAHEAVIQRPPADASEPTASVVFTDSNDANHFCNKLERLAEIVALHLSEPRK